MTAHARFAKGNRISVDFSGEPFAGTVTAVQGDGGPPRHRLTYAVEFDDGEILRDLKEEEMTKLGWEPPDPNVEPGELLAVEEAMKGPKAIKVDDRVRVWWEENEWYDGLVTEVQTKLGVNCRPTLAFRVLYDDGDDFRHTLGDYPLEKLTNRKGGKVRAERPEPMRLTRVTPKDAVTGSKRTRSSEQTEGALAPRARR